MRVLAKLFTFLTILFFATCTGGIIYFDDYISCDENNEMVEFARSLSQERLSHLYSSMEEYSLKDDLPEDGYHLYRDDVISPEPFKDIPASRIWPQTGRMELRKCFDHGVFMSFKGVGRYKQYDKEKQIVLSWGEYSTEGSEVIWPK